MTFECNLEQYRRELFKKPCFSCTRVGNLLICIINLLGLPVSTSRFSLLSLVTFSLRQKGFTYFWEGEGEVSLKTIKYRDILWKHDCLFVHSCQMQIDQFDLGTIMQLISKSNNRRAGEKGIAVFKIKYTLRPILQI